MLILDNKEWKEWNKRNERPKKNICQSCTSYTLNHFCRRRRYTLRDVNNILLARRRHIHPDVIKKRKIGKKRGKNSNNTLKKYDKNEKKMR